MSPISPSDGPVAVTGASGYIGAWVVHDCCQAGYTVRAVVRDRARPDKCDHLLAINEMGFPGTVELFEADLGKPGSYDAPFAGCVGICHVGAVMGRPGANKETPQQVFDGSFTDVKHVWASAQKAGTVKRFVQTSSMAAVAHGPPAGFQGSARDFFDTHIFTEDDWVADADPANIPKDRNTAYAAAKKQAEKALFDVASGAGSSFEACTIQPTHVLGPLMAINNDDYLSWQYTVKAMLQGEPMQRAPGPSMLWNIVDVRDCAAAHRLALESPTVTNGDRFLLCASTGAAEMATWELQAQLARLYPGAPVGVAGLGVGETPADPAKAYRRGVGPRLYNTKARKELGLKPVPVDECIRDTVESYIALGLLDAAIATTTAKKSSRL